jgi:hypothetical protein
VICPRGNGIDTHRVWEALYLGVVPVVQRSSLDALYGPLPVLIIESFENLTATFLEEQARNQPGA